MKKLVLFLLLALPAAGQTFSGYSGADTFVLPPWRFCFGNDPGNHNACFTQSTVFDKTAYENGHLDYEFAVTTVTALPSASALTNYGRVFWVSDAQNTSDCSIGGASTFVLCVSNGLVWVPIGGGGNTTTQPFLLRTNSPNGTTLNQLVEYDLTHTDSNGVGEVQNAALSSKNVIGVCIANCGTSGVATIATYLAANCITDGQSTVGDFVSASGSAGGQCNDYGAGRNPSVQTIGRVSKANTGGGTISQVDFFLGDIVGPGSSGGSGTVSNCGSNNSNAYYATAGTVVSCDSAFTDDGAGHPTSKSLGLTDNTTSGFFYLTQGAAPTVSAVNSVYFYAPVSVTSYAWVLPGAAGTGCLQASNASGVVTISFTGVGCGSGSGSVTSFSSGNLSPLFTTSVATPTTTPALSFTLSNAGANTYFGNTGNSSAAPSFATLPACANDGSHALTYTNGTGFVCTAITGGATLQTNGVNNTSQSILNLQNGAGISITNPSSGNVQVASTASSVPPVTANIPTLGLGVWYSADCITYTVASGVGTCSTPTNGSSVLWWADRSGNTDNAVHFGSAACTFNTNQINSLPAVNFDGTGNCFFRFSSVGGNGIGGWQTAMLQESTVFWVAQSTGATSGTQVVMGGENGALEVAQIQGTTNLMTIELGPGNAMYYSAVTTGLTSWHQMNVACDALTVPAARIDEANVTLNSLGGPTHCDIDQTAVTAPQASDVLGRNSGGVNPFKGNLAELIFYRRRLSTTEITQVETYLHNKYGL